MTEQVEIPVPRTSVVIPCYRDDRFLLTALESVAAQTRQVREIIVIDDGSPTALKQPEQWRGPTLIWERTVNQGLGAARNEGIRRATGEFIAFLDADDFWREGKIAAQEDLLDQNPGAVACYTQCIDEPGFFAFGPYPEQPLSPPALAAWLWESLFFPPSSVLVRHSALDHVKGFAEGLVNGEDLEMWVKLLSIGNILGVDRPLTWYRVHDGQITSNEVRKVMGAKAARQLAIEQHTDLLVEGGLDPDTLWNGYRHAIMCVYFRRNFAAARPMLWDYWKSHPQDFQVFWYLVVSCMPAKLIAKLRG